MSVLRSIVYQLPTPVARYERRARLDGSTIVAHECSRPADRTCDSARAKIRKQRVVLTLHWDEGLLLGQESDPIYQEMSLGRTRGTLKSSTKKL